MREKESSSKVEITAKEQIRYSIFTIEEEEDERNETNPNINEEKTFDIELHGVLEEEDDGDEKLLADENEEIPTLPEELNLITD